MISKRIVPVSFIMSVYINDKVEWVNDAIESIINGTVLPDEFLIYCDGPVSDGVSALLEHFSSSFSFIFIFYNNTNFGRAYSRDFLINKSNNSLVAIMDADDISLPYRLEHQYSYIINNPSVDIVGGQILEFSSHADKLRNVPVNLCDIYHLSKSRMPVNHVTLLFKKDSILSVGGYLDAGVCEDYYLLARSICNNLIIHNLDEVLVNVRVEEEFFFRRRGFSVFLDHYFIAKFFYDKSFISFPFFLSLIFVKFIVYNSPAFVLKFFYKFVRN